MIKIGLIITNHGYKGELKVKILSDEPKRFEMLDSVFLETEEKLRIENVRYYNAGALIKFAGIDTKEEAAKYRGKYLCIAKEDVLPLPENSFYIFQLVGLKVYENNQYLGALVDVISNPAHDLYLVRTESGKEIPIPALKEIVKKVDLVEGIIEVVLPEGFIE